MLWINLNTNGIPQSRLVIFPVTMFMTEITYCEKLGCRRITNTPPELLELYTQENIEVQFSATV